MFDSIFLLNIIIVMKKGFSNNNHHTYHPQRNKAGDLQDDPQFITAGLQLVGVVVNISNQLQNRLNKTDTMHRIKKSLF